MADIEEPVKKEDVQVFRFKFTQEIMNMLQEFAQIHKYDDKEIYKEAWDNWTKENEEIIKGEETRLTNLGWTGKIKDKMYKSAKYYFRNKKEKKRGPLKDLIQRKSEFFKELEPIINDLLAELDPYYKSPYLTIFDIMIASHLWGMYIFPEYQFKKGVHAYLQDIKNQFHLHFL